MRWPAASCRRIASELNDMISRPSLLHEERHSRYGDVRNVYAPAGLRNEMLLDVPAGLTIWIRVWFV